MATSLTLYFADDFADEAWAGLSYKLEVPQGDRSGEWVLGRHPASDLTISVRNVSRRHAAIAYSYAADLWSVQDLNSTKGTSLNGKWLTPGDLHPLKIGDRLYVAANLINVVEDEQDTVGSDEGPPTLASTEPMDYRPVAEPPPPPPAAPPSSKTPWDSLYLGTQWVISGTTPAGKVYRLIVAGAAVAGFILLMEWLTQ
jgi:pSer/pThr/pTyr-binding forkhead associated (FHA) protein